MAEGGAEDGGGGALPSAKVAPQGSRIGAARTCQARRVPDVPVLAEALRERAEAPAAEARAAAEAEGAEDAAGPKAQTLLSPPTEPLGEPMPPPLQGLPAWPVQDLAERPSPHGLAATAVSELTFAAEVSTRAAGHVALAGPCGRVEHVRVAEVDSPEAIEHCLRAVFRLPPGAGLVVRDGCDCAVPLGLGLLNLSPHCGAGGAGVYQVEVVGGAEAASPTSSVGREGLLEALEAQGDSLDLDEQRRVLAAALRKPAFQVDASTVTPGSESELNSATQGQMLLPNSVQPAKDGPAETAPESPGTGLGASSNWMSTMSVQDEFDFWCRLLDAGGESTPDLATTMRSADDKAGSGARLFQRSVPFDTSPQHVDAMYDAWAGEDGLLRKDVLSRQLDRERHFSLSATQLDAALDRVCEQLRDASVVADGRVPRFVFASLWQRLVLGAVCRQGGVSTEPAVRLIEYTERESLQERNLSERSFLFGGHGRAAEERTMTLQCSLRAGPKTHWAWVETSSSELLMRMAVKFFLHPLATEDMLKAAREGTTKIDRYRHQYFISLEVYALDAQAAASPEGLREECASARPTRDRITRSTISLLATGSPPTRSKPSTCRNWLLSVVNYVDKRTGSNPDPLDCFTTDQTAARKVLQSIRDDLKAHKRQREYQADFLLFSVIDRAAGELTPIYNAYGRRLRWLQARLDARPTSLPKSYIDEVSKVRHELQELRQWVGQLRGILHHLECDCSHPADGRSGEAPWRFGADAQSHGQSIRVFLRHTTYFLEQAADRLSVLDDLVRTFTADVERYKSDSMNQALFVLTMATAVFLPAQFLAGVYGMNFVTSDGRPGIPELTSEHGYLIFWLVTGSLLLGLPILMCVCLRCRGSFWHRPLPQAASGSRTSIKQTE